MEDGIVVKEEPMSEGDEDQTVKKRRQMRFSVEDDLALLRLVLSENPYLSPKSWRFIVDVLLSEIDKPLTLKNVRERVNLLLEQFSSKDDTEIFTSGVEPPLPSERDQLLEQ
ncbi:hypothetical protein GE061_008848 [Apolygus lucorum]|uniref:Uncharacterized protein n=1 Tax=Apolygus lucorum TaxID=248454 RepID=A0A8S9WNR2_APOLU|nr:hypothetical protein GE061_008848 [Apolygus lucorum]